MISFDITQFIERIKKTQIYYHEYDFNSIGSISSIRILHLTPTDFDKMKNICIDYYNEMCAKKDSE